LWTFICGGGVDPSQRFGVQMKLKFLILGGSRAGKTSLLRRYFNNSFEPQRRTPTLGSDFYSKKIEVDDEDLFDQTHRQEQEKEKQKEQEQRQDGEIEEGKSTATNTTTNDNFNNGNIYQIEGTISDNVNGGHDGGDKHPHRPPRHPSASDETNGNTSNRRTTTTTTKRHPVSIVCWDTPGRENVVIEKKGNKTRYTAVFSDRFFQNVHACLLVYDVTSTTSFTHVLRWHAELLERTRRMQANGERDKPLPIIIVGNKIDLMESQAEGERPRQASVQQRDVLGLVNKTYRGRDYHYEYSTNPATSRGLTSPSSANSSHNNNMMSSVSTNNNMMMAHDRKSKNRNRSRFELSTYMGTSSNVDYLEAVLSNEVYRGSYLDSLLKNEQQQGPDKDLVLLWAARNSVKHLEVSAKTGEGVDELMLELVRTALSQLEIEKGMTANSSKPLTLDHSKGTTVWSVKNERNNELDLHHRYLPKPRKSCFGCFEIPPIQMFFWRRGEP